MPDATPARREPPRVVIDTNVLLDLWVFEDPRTAALQAALADGSLTAVRSGATVDELSDVLGRPQFDISNEQRCTILRDWDRLAHPVMRVHAAPWHCTDPADQPFLDLAFSAGASWLITRDAALLKTGRRTLRDGLHIVQPVAIAALLAA